MSAPGDCGCCAPAAPATPLAVENRPSLTAVAWRLGTFASFREAMLRDLSTALPAGARLRTRARDDYGVMLLELWAAVGDVLTFYQERIANEAFLRTAVHRDSVERLTRLLGYRLRPAAGATTLLALTVERGKALVVPAGTRVQSVPREGETPQTYETSEPVAADARLNRLRVLPAPLPAPVLAKGSTGAWLAPGADVLSAAAALAPGDTLLLHAPVPADKEARLERLTVREVRVEDDRVRLEWSPPLAGDWDVSTARAHRLLSTARLYGASLPGTFVTLVPLPGATPSVRWDRYRVAFTLLTGVGATPHALHLDGLEGRFKSGALLLAAGPWGGKGVIRTLRVTAVAQAPPPPLTAAVDTTTTPVQPAGGEGHPPAPPGAVTRLTVEILDGKGAVAFDDVRQVTLHEVAEPSVRFAAEDHPGLLAAPAAYLPGRRTGPETVEVGRGIEGGRYTPGTEVSTADLAAGRRVFLTDGTATVSARVRDARVRGLSLAVAPAPADPLTARELGLAGEGAAPVTARLSAPLDDGWMQAAAAGARRGVTVRIGESGPHPLALEPAAFATPAALAAALQAGLRALGGGAAAFAAARVVAHGGRLAALAGVPGASVAFGPDPGNPETLSALGLDADAVRFADGVLSAPLAPRAAFSAPAPVLLARTGADAAQTVSLAGVLPPPAAPAVWLRQLAARLAARLAPLRATALAVDDRLLLLPAVPADPVPEYLVVEVEPAAPLELRASAAALLGNVAAASHGETLREEVLGDGDAAVPFQRFALRKKPVTHLAGAAGLTPALRVLVGGVAWAEVPTLYGAGPRDEVFTTQVAEDGTLQVRFGDGRTGARLPSGRANVTARYRRGAGLQGRVPAGSLTSLLAKPQGLRAAANPLDADGGADPQTAAEARRNAPGTVRTFGRAVSLRDFEDEAQASGEVARARADWLWSGESRVVHLTVAGAGGAPFSPDGLARLAAALDARRDPNRELRLGNLARVPVVVDAELRVDARRVAAEVQAAARAALLDALSFQALPFGRPLALSDVIAVLQGVPGVDSVDVDRFHFRERDPAFLAARGADARPLQQRLRIHPARPGPGAPPALLPAEQPWLQDPPHDLRLRTAGGLAP